MYENEIEILTDLGEAMYGRDNGPLPAINAAIELMRAAQPKDEAAEREHCLRIAQEVSVAHAAINPPASPSVILQRERAAARAECHIELCCLRKDVADWKRRAENLSADRDALSIELEEYSQGARNLQTQLAAAQEEIAQHEAGETHKHELYMEACDQRDALETELAAAQVEIEELRADRSDWESNHPTAARVVAAKRALETKLAAAQAEIEKWKDAYDGLHKHCARATAGLKRDCVGLK